VEDALAAANGAKDSEDLEDLKAKNQAL